MPWGGSSFHSTEKTSPPPEWVSRPAPSRGELEETGHMLSPSLCTPFFRGPSFVSSSTWSGVTPAIFISAPFQASDSQLDYVLKSPGEL